MRSLGCYENEVSLSKHELDLIYASVINEFFQVKSECRNSIAHAGLVADAMIARKILRDFTVVSRDVNGLVVFPDNRLVLVFIVKEFRLSGPIALSVTTPIRRSCFR